MSIRQMIRQGRAAQLASIRQMSRQVSRGSAGEYQADQQALYFCVVSCDFSISISNFVDLILLPFFLDESG